MATDEMLRGHAPEVARDLAANAAGSAAAANRHLGTNDRSHWRDRVAHLLRGKPDEQNWRVDLVGEQKVGEELQLLGPNWRVLHAVPGGDERLGIEHLLIGPAGVVALHTRRRPGSRVVVTERSIRVDHHRTHHLHVCRRAGARAGDVLTAACGFPVTVLPVIVFVDLRSFEVDRQPDDVYVTTRKRLIPWLDWMPATMEAPAVESVFSAARSSTTWTA
jgi:hypothetical protein